MIARALVATAVLLLSSSEALATPTATDCITANESSIRLRKEKKLIEARVQSTVCADAACPSEIRGECSQKVIETTAAIPTLVLSAVDASGNDLVGVHVTLDGKPFAERLDGTNVTLDPGPHAFRFEAAGHAPVEKTIVLREGERDRREVIRFEATSSPTRDPGRRTAGIVLVTVGVAGLGLGAIAAIVASVFSNNQKNESDPQRQTSDYNSARSWAHVSEIGFGAGGVALAVGGFLFFTAPYVTPGKTTGFGITIGGKL